MTNKQKDCEGCGETGSTRIVSDSRPLTISPDSNLAQSLREDFTAKRVAEELMRAAADMASAIGVEIAWSVAEVKDIDVDRERLTSALCRLSTAGGATLMGGKVNPISILDARDPLRLIREKRRKDDKSS